MSDEQTNNSEIPAASAAPAPEAASVLPDSAPAPLSEPANADGDPAPAEAPKASDEGTLFTVESLTMPEGFELDTEAATSIVAVINDNKLSSAERGAKLQEFYLSSINKTLTNIQTAVIQEFDNWRTELTNDPVLGGRNWPATETAVATVLQEFAPAGFTDLINKTGIGNHKAFAEFLVNVAKVTGEGKPVVGAPTSLPKSRAETLYPNVGKS